jgi:putative membrane-bound dehydrogenase-like protein
MMRYFLACVILAISGSWALVSESPAPKTHEVTLNGHTFTLPVGFEMELVAGPPLVNRPITADFDESGRLYVADSSGSNEKVDIQLQKKPHRIVRLEGTQGAGKYDKSTVFADGMMFPEGTMWYKGSLYVSAPPSIWKLTDSKGTDVADQRVEWFQGKTLTGCANDLHGPYLGPDGWIYWCKGAFAKQTYERPGKKPFVTRAAHIFRCRPDGSGLEPVMTGGMDNPVDVVFMPGGERIFTTTFLARPGGGKRDGLIHAIYGGINGKDHDPIYEHPWTSPELMPVLSHMGAAAPCGLTRYESAVFGPDYKDNLFACQFNMHKISRHVLRPSGSTFESVDSDFLVSSNLDFHPTDILEDADGSLIVVDTGGWYKLCCPTSQLVKPDILGAIYRVRKTGTPKVDDPRGLDLPWGELTALGLSKLLDDPRPAVRRRAIQALADMGEAALPALIRAIDSAASTEKRVNAVWAATRIAGSEARKVARAALRDDNAIVRQAAIHSISVCRDRDAVPLMLLLLHSPDAHNRRATAEALGRLGDAAAIRTILDALGQPHDRVLDHSLTYALIELDNPVKTAAGLDSAKPGIRRAALAALDQMDGGKLGAPAVTRELNSEDKALKETAWWIAGRHPEWGAALTSLLGDRLKNEKLTTSEQDELVRQLARFAKSPAIQDFLAKHLGDAGSSRESKLLVLRAMAQSGLKEAPPQWAEALTRELAGDDLLVLQEVVATLRAVPIPKSRGEKATGLLRLLAENPRTPEPLRLNALAAVPGGLAKIDPAWLAFLCGQLDPEIAVARRQVAVDILARAKLDTDQLVLLADVLRKVGPLELDRLLEPYTQSTDDNVGRKLLASLKDASARSALRAEMVKPRLAKYSAAIQKEAEELYALLNVDAAKQKARLEELLGSLKNGDIRRGQLVFNSAKASCAACHAIGYLGGNVGPDLTRIGQVRTERDLLEAIVFPSASFVRSYEPVLITLKNGKTHNGLIRKDTGQEVVLATGVNQEVRLNRSDIEDIQPSKVSIMPAGLDQQLSVQDLADLVAFLKACK